MSFNFESFCNNCENLSAGQIKAEIQAKLIALEGRRKAAEQMKPFADKNLVRRYQTQIRQLEVMAEMLAGDSSNANFLNADERTRFQQVLANARQSAAAL